MTNKPIYLDYMATTPIDPRVIEKMLEFMGPNSNFGNPASFQHEYGIGASAAVETARSQIATSIGAVPEDIIFTSGATEANNLAILGAARFYQRKGKHLITMTTEHKSCLDTFEQLEKEGFSVSYLEPETNGTLDINKLVKALRDDTILVSIMHVNNEIGVIQDIDAIAKFLSDKGIIFHVDGAQSAGKVAINLQDSNISLMSFSAHKNYGPKGIGALYIRHKPRIRIQPQSYGGGHERGLRSGTLATHQIVGMGEAFAISEKILESEQMRILGLRNELWNGIKNIPGLKINGDLTKNIAGILNFSVQGVDGSYLIEALNHKLAVSTMSACTSASIQPSYVLQAIGLNADLAKSSVRLSIGRFTTKKDILKIISIISEQISNLV
ncbi:MAG: IscS subfamily cysteine desulfurase [Legionellaceae bacterium]|nr:IscS subfamily cysteine desulfurase [Legionellaceae bacterium]